MQNLPWVPNAPVFAPSLFDVEVAFKCGFDGVSEHQMKVAIMHAVKVSDIAIGLAKSINS